MKFVIICFLFFLHVFVPSEWKFVLGYHNLLYSKYSGSYHGGFGSSLSDMKTSHIDGIDNRVLPRILYHYVLPKTATTSPSFSTSSSAHTVIAENRHFHEAPIIILHGLLGSSRNFQSWSRLLHKALHGKHDIVCIDLRNHGRSSLHGALPMSYELMAKDVIATLHYLNIPQCHLIGHSMGGKVGAMMSLMSEKYHGQLLSLAMLDISPIEYSEQDFDSVIECIEHLSHITDHHLPRHNSIPKTASLMSKRELAKIIDSYFSDRSLSMFIQSNLVQDGNSLTWSFQLPGIKQSLKELLLFRSPIKETTLFEDKTHSYRKRIRELLPVYILKGSNSKFVKSSHLSEISSLFPKFSIGSIKDASHWLHFEKPDETCQQITHYLGKVKQYYDDQGIFSELKQLKENQVFRPLGLDERLNLGKEYDELSAFSIETPVYMNITPTRERLMNF